jgi:hypothetical protein
VSRIKLLNKRLAMGNERVSDSPGHNGDLAELSRETVVRRRPVSAEFIAAMRDVGARPSLLEQLERELTAAK